MNLREMWCFFCLDYFDVCLFVLKNQVENQEKNNSTILDYFECFQFLWLLIDFIFICDHGQNIRNNMLQRAESGCFNTK
jgi:hypothetical protein